ncbi:MAG: hypothetical protein B6242_14890 [Anaerolineaceae bacterium 4572_78]|nr:MAG: hypothetical protein B6242_14890 [Anaerolineaceae bacterium 4572_78]
MSTVKQLAVICFGILFAVGCRGNQSSSPTVTPTLVRTPILIDVVYYVEGVQPIPTTLPTKPSKETPTVQQVIVSKTPSPTDSSTATQTPTFTATPTASQPPIPITSTVTSTVLTSTPTPPGTITLVEPPFQAVLTGARSGKLPAEFKWKWDGQGAEDCTLPDNQGFEVRIGPTTNGPMQIIGHVEMQIYIKCNPGGDGIFQYKIAHVGDISAVQNTESGAGQFAWDVTYIQIDPYQILSISPSSIFEVP